MEIEQDLGRKCSAWKDFGLSLHTSLRDSVNPTWEGGGAYLAPPPLTFLFVASKRMYMLVRNFLTFLIYQKPKF